MIKKARIMILFFTGLVLNVALIKPDSQKKEFTNLQVLPKDISSRELQNIMVNEFGDGLGVGCNFCHAQEKGSLHMDYASDEKPEKEIARLMMRMVLEINKKYFIVDNPSLGDSLMQVSCISCHHGIARPGLNE